MKNWTNAWGGIKRPPSDGGLKIHSLKKQKLIFSSEILFTYPLQLHIVKITKEKSAFLIPKPNFLLEHVGKLNVFSTHSVHLAPFTLFLHGHCPVVLH